MITKQEAQNRPVRVGILGTGYIARYHVEALKLYSGVRVAAACDLSHERVARFAEDHGIEEQFTSLDTMLEKGDLECVHICTPADNHFRASEQILSAGLEAYVEKPLSLSTIDAEKIRMICREHSSRIGVSHNFVYSPPYKRLTADIAANNLGALLAVDISWAKRFTPQEQRKIGWLAKDPRNILFEIGPHLFAHVVDLLPDIDPSSIEFVRPYGRVTLPNGEVSFNRWEVNLLYKGSVRLRLTMDFTDGFTEHTIKVRGTHGSAVVDFERCVYNPQWHTEPQTDLDSLRMSFRSGCSWIAQGLGYGVRVARAKSVGDIPGGSFAESIAASVLDFYSSDRNDADVAYKVVEFAEHASRCAEIANCEKGHGESTRTVSEIRKTASVLEVEDRIADVVVTGARGFIGHYLVHALAESGLAVDALVRPNSNVDEFESDLTRIIEVDLRYRDTFDDLVNGAKYIFHLARSNGETWDEYLHDDLEVTKRIAESCLRFNVQLIYVSSIAVYCPHLPGVRISETTPLSKAAARSSLYARSKVETEQMLQDLHKRLGLRMVIVRPGIVVGSGAPPYHPGVAEFPYSSTYCLVGGSGNNPLPIVLVEDCAEAMASIVTEQENGSGTFDGETFNLVGDPILTANDVLTALELETGGKIKRKYTSPLSEWAVNLVKYLARSAKKGNGAGLPSLNVVKGKAFQSQFDNLHARALLKWNPCEDRSAILRRGFTEQTKELIR